MSEGSPSDHRAYVGNPQAFDRMAASHFVLLAMLGLRGHHHLLDIGCGPLRSGRLLIPYLDVGHYFGLEPNSWLVRAGIQSELGQDAIRLKAPSFLHDDDFVLTRFGRKFDYVHAHSILTHAARWMLERLFEQVASVLERDGVFVGTFLAGEQDHAGSHWVYPDLVTYRWQTLVQLAAANGLSIFRLAWPHPKQSYFLMLRRERLVAAFLSGINQENMLAINDLITPAEATPSTKSPRASAVARKLLRSLGRRALHSARGAWAATRRF